MLPLSPRFSNDLWESMLCSLVLKALFSLHLSKMTWKFFFPSSSPQPQLFKKMLTSGKQFLIIYHTVLWQTTRIQGKEREKGKENRNPRLMISLNKNFCYHKVVFYLDYSSLEQVLSYVFLVPVLRLVFSLMKEQQSQGNKIMLMGRGNQDSQGEEFTWSW